MSELDERPYVGLRSFDTDDRQRFHGRSREALEVAALWQANRLTVLHGASGIGKTSLLQAGVIPALDPERADVLPAGRVAHGSAFPLAALPEHNPYTFALLTSWAMHESPARLSGLTLSGFLRARPEQRDRYGDPLPILIAIDQAEELFSCPPHREAFREAIVADLVAALDELPDLRLLISVREDHLAAVLPYEGRLGRRSRARVPLQPFALDAALEAVRRPLENTARSFAQGAAEELVDELRTVRLLGAGGESATVSIGTVEPVQLQVVCAELWHALPEDVTVITGEHVRRHGDVAGAIAGFCARALSEVAAEHDLDPGALRTWVRRTFITELGSRGTTYEGLSETAGMPNAVLHALEDRRLLRAERRSGSRWYELQHDRLIEPIQADDDESLAEAASTGNPAEHLHNAQLALAEGQFPLAERYANMALIACGDGDPRAQAEIHSFLGNVAHDRGEPEAALSRYQSAAGLFAVQGDTQAVGLLLKARGRLLLQLGRPSEALNELRGALARLPTDPGVQTEMAWTFWQLGQRRNAVDTLTALLNSDRSDIEARRSRGEILAEEGHAKEALADLDLLAQPSPSARAARALALAQLGRLKDAIREATSATADAPLNGPVLWRAARIHDLNGDAGTASSLARRAVTATSPHLAPRQHDQVQVWLQRTRPDAEN